MFDFFRKIKRSLAILQAQNLRSRLVKILNSLNPSAKNLYRDAAILSTNSVSEAQKAQINENISDILKKTEYNCGKLLNYIKASGTLVYFIDNTEKKLNLIKEETGLIFQQKGLSAIYLSLITSKKISLCTKPMFVLEKGFNDYYKLLYWFYKWYCMKFGLSGFENKIQKKLKKYLLTNETDLRGLNLDEVDALAQAILREQEAANFVVNYANQREGANRVIEKLKNDGSAQV